jgi:hypothetical protein
VGLAASFALLPCVVPLAVHAAADKGPEWTFDGKDAKDELNQWVNLNQLQPLKMAEVKDAKGNKRSVLLTESLGVDPYMFPGGGWNVANYEPFDGKKNKTLYLGVRVNMANTWQIYYVTMKNPGGWGEEMRQNFDVPQAADFQDLAIEVSRGGWQENDVKIFRIDPGTAGGVKAEIDYISFAGPPQPPKAVHPRGSLAAVWAALRR